MSVRHSKVHGEKPCWDYAGELETWGSIPNCQPTRARQDLSWENYLKEVFLDSDTNLALISTPPGSYPWESVVPPKEMTHIRDEINHLTESQRVLAHGLVMPQLGKVNLDFMDQQADTLKVDAWKC